MDIKITPGRLSGEAVMPPSKSYSHRALICAALGGGEAVGAGESEDIAATRSCLEALKAGGRMNANESGSTMRFMIPIALALNGECEIEGSARLMERPLDDYFKIFGEKGIVYSQKGRVLSVRGRLVGGTYRIRGDVSSQFITGLLFALPLTGEECEIVLTTPLQSRSYVEMTRSVQREFGIESVETERGFLIPAHQSYKKSSYTVEGDFSQAAFFLAMGSVSLKGLNHASLQGDRAIIDVYGKMGMKIEETENGYVTNGRSEKNITVDVSQIPDCVPALACLMAVTKGEGRIVNAARLRLKESDRLKAVTEELTKLGADVYEGADYLVINGRESLKGGVCDSHNDHRIAMAIASVTPRCTGEVVIKGAECVKKSMPDFWEKFRKLGGNIDEFILGQRY